MISKLLITIILWLTFAFSLAAQNLPGQARLNELFSALSSAKSDEWQIIEDEIWELWARSGSPSMDLLLLRGKAALAEDETAEAIEHLTALIDHAPNFAEGWNARATAYFEAGLYGPSLADIRQTIALEPRHFGAWSGLGLILEHAGEAQGALLAYREVLKLHPHREDVLEAITRLERAVGEFEI